jgi:hypothetical protein
MRRLLIASLLCMTTFMLEGCHKRFHASIENGTGQRIYVSIQFRDLPIGHGYIEVNNGLDLTQKIEDIRYIDYRIESRKCRIDKDEILKIARPDSDSKFHPERMIITLRDCSGVPAESHSPMMKATWRPR